MLQSSDARRTPASARSRSPSASTAVCRVGVRAARRSAPVGGRGRDGDARPRRARVRLSEGPRRPQRRLRRASSRSRSAATTRSTPTSDRRGASTTSRRPRSRGRTAPATSPRARGGCALPFALAGWLGVLLIGSGAARACGPRRRAAARGFWLGYGVCLALSVSLQLHLREVRYYPLVVLALGAIAWLEVRRHVRGDLPPLRHTLLLAPVLFGAVQPVLSRVHGRGRDGGRRARAARAALARAAARARDRARARRGALRARVRGGAAARRVLRAARAEPRRSSRRSARRRRVRAAARGRRPTTCCASSSCVPALLGAARARARAPRGSRPAAASCGARVRRLRSRARARGRSGRC